MRGVCASSRNVRRDAMDAVYPGRGVLLADGKGVQARRPSGRCQVSRDGDVGPYGPDTPDNPRGDGDNKARSLRGEHEISR